MQQGGEGSLGLTELISQFFGSWPLSPYLDSPSYQLIFLKKKIEQGKRRTNCTVLKCAKEPS